MNKKNAVEQFRKKVSGQIDHALTDSLLAVTSVISVEKQQELFSEGEEGK